MKLKKVIFVGLIIYITFNLYQEYKYRGALPAHIEVTRLVDADIDGFREYWGGAIFLVAETTLESIEHDGLDYLNKDLYSRRAIKKQRDIPAYGSWKKGECYADTFALTAMLYKGNKLYEKIISEAASKGAFCTRALDGPEIIVMPKLKMVMWTFAD